jgi:predicted HD phosphohydrolase
MIKPIRFHVAVKRYLCIIHKNDWKIFSLISQHSLRLQGGIFSAESATVFIQLFYIQDAVKL